MFSCPNFPPSLATHWVGKSIPTSKLYQIHLRLTETDLLLSQSHVNSNFKTRRRDETIKQTVMRNRSFRGREFGGSDRSLPILDLRSLVKRKRVKIHLITSDVLGAFLQYLGKIDSFSLECGETNGSGSLPT